MGSAGRKPLERSHAPHPGGMETADGHGARGGIGLREFGNRFRAGGQSHLIHVLESRLRQMRRWLSRSEWSLRFLGLSKIREPGAERGLVLIQIDGLSRQQLE